MLFRIWLPSPSWTGETPHMLKTTASSGVAPGEPIAIIGIGCRFPGGADTPEAFWRNLLGGVDAIGDVPRDRWAHERHFDPRPGVPGKTYSRWGGFLSSIDGFEPECFGISPREAAYIDPQQRLLLETAWGAMEDGGQAVERLAGSRTGVFVGISTTDYANLQSTIHDLRSIDVHTATGGAFSVAANRISYCFNLKGPSLAVDTACSSSLVATHLACRSLWEGESELALAGGVNTIISPANYIAFSAATMLSRTGRCRAFDAGADGFVRGEGAGMVLLKPLPQALADGDRVYAVILATAVNQDGRTAGITMPDRDMQETLLRETCRRAGIEPRELQYVEAHGTGTPVGDPIEANALGTVLSQGRPPESPCLLGSVKTAIGHLEAAAGIAGLIKTALALRHRRIPPNLHFTQPNPLIPFEELGLRVPTADEPWPAAAGRLLAGVNSFGFGGTNAQIVLRDHAEEPSAPAAGDARVQLLTLSARSPEALEELARSYRDLMAEPETATRLPDLCHTAATRRSRHEHGLSLVGRNPEDFCGCLDAFLAGEKRPGLFSGRRRGGAAPPVVFAFCGQGAQWWAMGRELLASEPVFAERIRAVDELLGQLADWSLLEELGADEADSRLHRTAIAQPALFAIQVALAALWKSWGIEPAAVIGHSAGEIAAAQVAGILSLAEGVRIVYHRGRCMDVDSSRGRMLAAGLSPEEARVALRGHEQVVSLAAVNSPRSVTLSGDPEALEAIARNLAEREVFHRILKVDYAFHSPRMDAVREDVLASLGRIEPRPAQVPLISTVTGEPIAGEHLDAAYWWRGLRETVLFGPAAERALEQGLSTFLEVGPHPVLSGYLAECLHHRRGQGTLLPSLRRGEDERATLLGSLGALHVLGHEVDWNRLWPKGGRVVSLPAHPWRRERYWHEPAELGEPRLRRDFHPLLAREVRGAEPSWQTPLDPRVLSYLPDHRVDRHAVLPAAAFVEMAAAAVARVTGESAVRLDELRLVRALFLPEGGEAVTVEIRLEPETGSFLVRSGDPQSDGGWTLHGMGGYATDHVPGPPNAESPEEIRERLKEIVDADTGYRRFAETGLHYGPAFRGLREIRRRDGEALGEAVLPESLEPTGYTFFHPALLDACFQVLLGAAPWSLLAEGKRLFLPVGIRRATFFHASGRRVFCHARLTHGGERLLEADLDLLDPDGRLLARIEGFQAQALDRSRAAAAEDPLGWIFGVRWENKPHPQVLSAARPAGFIPPLRDLAAAARKEGHALSSRLGITDRAPQAEEAMDRIALAFVARVLREAGFGRARGERFSEGALGEKLDPASRHRRLLHRFLQHLAAGGHLRPADDGDWEVAEPFPPEDPETLWREAWGRHPGYLAELNLVGRCGRRLAEVLRGELNPLEILFPEGPSSTMALLYESSTSFVVVNRMARAALASVHDALPPGRILRVLEVGAGTGGLTAGILPLFDPQRTSYLFTDVSASFLAKAEMRFGNHPFVSFGAFDLERDPADQGLAPGQFDVVVASDVLHAVRDLREALARLRDLLSPGGLLLLIEAERRSPRVDLVFGLTEGWWRFEDHDLRPEHPLLHRTRWRKLLADLGFEETETLPPQPDAEESVHILALARAPQEIAEADREDAAPREIAEADRNDATPADSAPGRWLLFTDRGGLGRRLQQRWAEADVRAVEVAMGAAYARLGEDRFAVSPERPEEMKRLLEELAGERIEGIVHLWSLDAPEPDTLGSLRRAETISCHSVLHLLQALHEGGRLGGGLRVVLVTRGAQATEDESVPVSLGQTPLLGLGRVLMNEHTDLRTKLVDLDPGDPAGDIDALLAELQTDDPEEEVAFRRESRLVPRATRLSAERVPPSALDGEPAFRLFASTAGALDQLAWRETERRRPGPGEVEIAVEAAGLNFRDVLKALGLYPAENDDYLLLGDECAGRVIAVGPGVKRPAVGDAVLAMAPGCFGSRVIAPADAVLPKPESMTSEEAATIPVAFLTALYALEELARLREGETVLVHAGAGGVGMAAVQIALRAGARVFATAGSPEKREILELMGVEQALDSRSLAFADRVMELTEGRGVDVVLNSLAGKAIGKGLSCLAPFGRFLELGKRDIVQNSRIGLWAFRKNISFHSIDLGRVARENPRLLREMFERLVRRFEAGTYHPLPHTLLMASRETEAFRLVAQGRHIGKVVLSLDDPELRVEKSAGAGMSFLPEATYLVTGGLGGFGLVVAQWIVDRGGRHLILLGRSGAASAETQAAVRELEARGARILVAAADVTDPNELAPVLDEKRTGMPPLRGVFHAAMVLDDGILLQLDRERFSRVMEPKVAGVWNLHQLTLDRDLDHFVMFSSVSSWVGTPGQANYVAANAFLDAFAYARRRSFGRPALSINWGRLDEVGYVSRHPAISEILGRRGFLGFSPRQAMIGLDHMMRRPEPQIGFLRIDWSASAQVLGNLSMARRMSVLFGELSQEKNAEDEGARVREALRAARPEERGDILRDYMRHQVARVLGTAAAKLDLTRPLNQMGFDSLMAVELKNHIDTDLALSLPTGVLMEEPTVEALATAVLDLIEGRAPAANSASASPPPASPGAPSPPADPDPAAVTAAPGDEAAR